MLLTVGENQAPLAYYKKGKYIMLPAIDHQDRHSVPDVGHIYQMRWTAFLWHL